MNAQTKTQATAPPPQRMPAVRDIQDELLGERMSQQLKMALPEHISVEKFQRVVITAVNKTPDLTQADRLSLFTACIECAQDGLLPNGKEAALVIYNTKDKRTNQWTKKAQYMPMISGIYKRARNSGEITMLNAHLVFENDEFSYEYGFEPSLVHKPALADRGKIIGAYAVAVTKDGNRDMEFMPNEEIEQVRAASKAAEDGPWVNWWGEMARKTVVRRLAKRLPVSSDLERIIQRVDSLYELDQRHEAARETNLTPTPRPTRGDFIEHHASGGATDDPGAKPANVDEPADFDLVDETGDDVGTFGPRAFAQTVQERIQKFTDADALQQFVGNNSAQIERLSGQFDAYQYIKDDAATMAKRLAQPKPDEAQAQPGGETAPDASKDAKAPAAASPQSPEPKWIENFRKAVASAKDAKAIDFATGDKFKAALVSLTDRDPEKAEDLLKLAADAKTKLQNEG